MNLSEYSEKFMEDAERQLRAVIQASVKKSDTPSMAEIFLRLEYSDGEKEFVHVSGQMGDITPDSPIGAVALRLPIGKTYTIPLEDNLEVAITVISKG